MEDIVKTKDSVAAEIGEFISEHNGENVLVIDVKDQNSWTDYIIIATSTSMGHLKGLVRQLKQLLDSNGVDILRRHKQIIDDGWELIDCGDFVINIMNKEMREFYNLDKLWFSGKIIYHSSKSS